MNKGKTKSEKPARNLTVVVKLGQYKWRDTRKPMRFFLVCTTDGTQTGNMPNLRKHLEGEELCPKTHSKFRGRAGMYTGQTQT